nr:hypothetical protein [Tanacetum cinerariifolium]
TNEEPQNIHQEENAPLFPCPWSHQDKWPWWPIHHMDFMAMWVLKEEIASPVELAKAYMASRPYKVARRQDLVLHNKATKIALKITNGSTGFENGFTIPRSRGRSATYHMACTSYARSPSTFTQKMRAFRTSIPRSDSALAADIVATSTLPGVSITPALVEPPQKKCAFQMSAPEDDLFEIDDALAANIVATLTLPRVSLTPVLVENNKQMFPEVVKVLEQAEPKALELTRILLHALRTRVIIIYSTKSVSPFRVPSGPKYAEAGDEKGEVPEVEDGMEVVLEPNKILLVLTLLPLFGSKTTSIPSSTSRTSPFSSSASTIDTSSSFGVSSITASNFTSGPATSIFWSTWDRERAYGFGTTYNNHTSMESMEEDSMLTSTPVFDMSVDSMVAEDTHVHGTDMSVDSMVAEDTHVHGTDMSVDSMVANDTYVHGTDMSVDSMVAEDTHVHRTDMSVDGMVAEDTDVHGTGATLNYYDHIHMDMMVEDCMQTPTGETYVASPLFNFDSGTQPICSSYALHLDWWPT